MSLDVAFGSAQRRIIKADPSNRLYVDAGPGTGKTAVAIARVAWLISDAGLDPSEIWLVSFTRTAVQEIRNRVADLLAGEVTVSGLRISTLDSMAWQIRSGFDQNAAPPSNYGENIRRLDHLLKNSDGIAEFFSSLRHLVVDEAQDIVGDRAQLVVDVINSLPAEAGVTVLADEAQAIYGFADEDSAPAVRGVDLPTALRRDMPGRFAEIELVDIHRTDDSQLVHLLIEGRATIRRSDEDSVARHESLRELIKRSRHFAAVPPSKELTSEQSAIEQAFVLFRTRGDALQAANYLDNRPRRIRLSGLPPAVHPWLAETLWDWTEPEIGEREFRERWATRVTLGGGEADTAWSRLLRLVGVTRKSISTRQLARLVARPLPPLELTSADFGDRGPIFGTIHAAKGREADHVWMYLPQQRDLSVLDREAVDEETRVLFVGASRARRELHVGEQSASAFARTLQGTNRAYTTKWSRNSPAAAVEIGRQGDIGIGGLVGRDYFASAENAGIAQETVRSMGGVVSKCTITRGPGPDYHYALRLGADDGPVVAHFSQQLNRDLFSVGKEVGKMRAGMRGHPSGTIRHLSSLGVRTVAVDPEDSIREALHSPWRESGFFLAPMVCAYPVVYYK